jgi:hypothetical protein
LVLLLLLLLPSLLLCALADLHPVLFQQEPEQLSLRLPERPGLLLLLVAHMTEASHPLMVMQVAI